MFGVLRSGDWAWIWKQGHLICEIEWYFSTRKLWVYHEASSCTHTKLKWIQKPGKHAENVWTALHLLPAGTGCQKTEETASNKEKERYSSERYMSAVTKEMDAVGLVVAQRKEKKKGEEMKLIRKSLWMRCSHFVSHPQTGGSESNAPNFQVLNLFPKPSNCYYKHISKELRVFWLSYKGFICHLSKTHNSWRQ